MSILDALAEGRFAPLEKVLIGLLMPTHHTQSFLRVPNMMHKIQDHDDKLQQWFPSIDVALLRC